MTEFTKLKRLVYLRAGGTPSVSDESMWADAGLPWVTISDMTRKSPIVETDRSVSQRGVTTKRLPIGSEGTVLFAMYASVGAVATLGCRASWNQAILGVTGRPGTDLRFIRYWLEHLRPDLSALVRSNTQDNLNADQVGNLPVLLLPLDTQRKVSDYLDRETGRLGALEARKVALIERLQEEIDAAIMLQIGESPLAAPECSTVAAGPIRRAIQKVTRAPRHDAEMITAYRDGQVTARSLRRAEGYTESGSETAQVQGVRANDVVVHGLDGFAGAIGYSEVDGVCSPVYHVCTPLGGSDPAYIARLLRILAIQGYLALFATSTRERAVDFRNWAQFRQIPIPIVPVDEQRRIGDKIRGLVPLKAAMTRSIALARERRQALITAAVTGQLDLPEAA